MIIISYNISDITSMMLNSNVIGSTTALNSGNCCTCNSSNITNSSISTNNFEDLISILLQLSLSNTVGLNVPIGLTGVNSNSSNSNSSNSNSSNSNNLNTDNSINNGYLGNIQDVSTSVEGLSSQQRIDRAILSASQKYGVDASLIRAIIKTESNFQPNVTSKSGAIGLMQIMPSNVKALNISNPYNIEENIDGGTRFFKSYLDKYNGNVEMALMAYNGGPTRMADRGVKSINDIYKMPKETQNYVPKVMNAYNDYKKSYSL